MLSVEGQQIEIAVGRASRPYNYDRSRIYQGIIGFWGPKARGWLYDPNLVTTYSSHGAQGALGSGTIPVTATPPSINGRYITQFRVTSDGAVADWEAPLESPFTWMIAGAGALVGVAGTLIGCAIHKRAKRSGFGRRRRRR